MSNVIRMNTLQIHYDAVKDVLTIEGTKYQGQLFREFAELLPEGAVFTLVARLDNEDGTKHLYLERLPDIRPINPRDD